VLISGGAYFVIFIFGHDLQDLREKIDSQIFLGERKTFCEKMSRPEHQAPPEIVRMNPQLIFSQLANLQQLVTVC